MTEQPVRTRWRPPEEPCRNCADPTPGRYCPRCGQRKIHVRVSLRVLFGDVLQDELLLNRATPRTIIALLFRPGLLTHEYVNGRMARYIPPFRLYLVASVLFFLMASFVGLRALDRVASGRSDSGGAVTVANVDSTRAALQERQRQLEAADTAQVPAVARAALRQSLASTQAALAALDDAAARDPATVPAAAADTVRDSGVEDAGVEERAQHDEPAVGGGGIQPWAQDLRTPIGWPWLQRAIDRKVAQLGHLTPGQALSAVVADMLDYAPHMVFVMLPLFALILKLLYIRRRRYYAEHITFALHVHAFVFVMFIIMFLLPWSGVNGILMLWLGAYVWLAMKRVYGQGWFRTTVKWSALGWSYMFLLALGLFGLVAAAVLV